MKKTLLALAVGAVAALPVSALANGPTLYGQIDLSVENVNDNGGWDGEGLATTDNTYVLRDNSSRLGVRGEAETDIKGLSGIYKAEFGLEADDGNAAIDQRDIYVGLQHESFGTLKMGNFDTPFRKAQGTVDQFNDGTLDIANYVANETRSADIIQYSSPVIADMITVNVATTTEETGESGGTSVSVVYDKDGLYLAVAKDSNVLNDSNDIDVTQVPNGAAEVDALRAVVGYTADGFEVGFLYQTAEVSNSNPSQEDTSMVLSAALKAGKWKLKAQAGQTEGDDGVSATDDEVLNAAAIGFDYALGKATTAYALFGTEEAKYSDANRDVAGVGLRHKF